MVSGTVPDSGGGDGDVVGDGDGGGQVRDPKATVSEHFNGIMAELLRAMSCDNWRERKAGCAGMTDLIMGRGFKEVRPSLVKSGWWLGCCGAAVGHRSMCTLLTPDWSAYGVGVERVSSCHR